MMGGREKGVVGLSPVAFNPSNGDELICIIFLLLNVLVVMGYTLRRVHANENPEQFLLFSFKCVHAKFELYKVFMQFRSFFRLN